LEEAQSPRRARLLLSSPPLFLALFATPVQRSLTTTNLVTDDQA
jgi:hypothetical protein